MTTRTSTRPKLPRTQETRLDDAMEKEREQTLLSRIADAMKSMALERAAMPDPMASHKPTRHIFTRGARVYLWFLRAGSEITVGGKPLVVESDQWKIAVARDNVFPSEEEMKIFRKAFGVTGIFFTDTPQMWKANADDPNAVTRYAYVIRWFVRARVVQEAAGI